MGAVTMRNVKTGELKPVESESAEFQGLIAERYDHQGAPKPLWEQTGGAHARRVVSEAEDGALQEEQLGYDNKPLGDVQYDVSEVGPEKAPHLALTPGEVEMGMDPEEKQEQLQQQFARDQARVRGETLEDGLDAIASSEIDPADAGLGGDPDGDPEGDDPGPTKEQLKERARELDIPGRSAMDKEQLLAAIEEAEAGSPSEDDGGEENGGDANAG